MSVRCVGCVHDATSHVGRGRPGGACLAEVDEMLCSACPGFTRDPGWRARVEAWRGAGREGPPPAPGDHPSRWRVETITRDNVTGVYLFDYEHGWFTGDPAAPWADQRTPVLRTFSGRADQVGEALVRAGRALIEGWTPSRGQDR